MSSSQPHRVKTNIQLKKVDELVRKYQKSHHPSPVLRDILNSSKSSSLLVSAVRRQVSLVKCRSQDFEDGQITVYDKALLILSNYGDVPDNPGALEIYLTEFLGIVPIAAFSESRDTAASHLELHDVLTKASGFTPEIQPKPLTQEQLPPEQPQTSTTDTASQGGLGITHDEARVYKANYTTSDDEWERCNEHGLHERVERILAVYHQAKEDYFGIKERDGVDSLSAARFLRDTAENALRYLRANGLSNHSCVPDLERVFGVARDKTTELLGGRKRHFDDGKERRNRKRGRRVLDSYRPRRRRHSP